MPIGASLTAIGCTPSKLTALSASPAMLAPSAMRAEPASIRATAAPPPSRSARTARCMASLAKGTARSRPASVPLLVSVRRSPLRVGPHDMAPRGDEMPARPSSHPASMVSATGSATAKRPVSRSTAKPSARSAPAPPSLSGTQASVRPASSRAVQAGPFQFSPAALLTVCGSHRSRKIRVAVSATMLSLAIRSFPPELLS